MPHADGFLRLPGDLPRDLLEFLLLARIHDLTVQLQSAHIGSLLTVDMVEDLGAREIAVKREGSGNPTLQRIINQLDTQFRMIF